MRRQFLTVAILALGLAVGDRSVWAEDLELNADGGNTCCEQCCGGDPGCWVSPWRVYGEYLLLRPVNERISYALPFNGANVAPGVIAPVPVANEAAVDHGFGSGVRIGAIRAVDCYSSIGFQYAFYDNLTSDAIAFGAPGMQSLVNHPGTLTANSIYLTAAAQEDLRFNKVDVDYRHVFACDEFITLNYLVGLRYANLHQAFDSRFTNVNTIETVSTSNDFDGLGLRVGLEGERRTARGFLCYGKTSASFIGGMFRGRYTQTANFPAVLAQGGWDEDRVISIFEGEVGVGWANACGNLRLTVGYTIEGWFNTLKNRDFISAMRTGTSNRSVFIGDPLAFDGMTTRLEVRF